MLIDFADHETVEEAVAQYETLLKLQKETGTFTKRTRDALLRQLDEADLVAVAVELQRRGLIGGAR
jgi:hypothetical protein